ncbi:beta/gamma crystallin family protein [Hyphobacterium sp. CCMP332]|uniref:beta/gamma crystallin-related protein n=1 Tax=Hyphobacterium sp. CCMP332 TaxID=2749086 RepID=UPI00164EF743|nr:beta/gamma crystallin family protein [Hyphobacterium sp. CCMP332]
MEYGAGGRPGGGLSGGGGWTGRPRGDGSLTLYAGPNFTGQSINIDRENSNLTSLRFNDRAMSAEVEGRGSWTVCEDANFGTLAGPFQDAWPTSTAMARQSRVIGPSRL